MKDLRGKSLHFVRREPLFSKCKLNQVKQEAAEVAPAMNILEKVQGKSVRLVSRLGVHVFMAQTFFVRLRR
jgi:hypothetical protein